MKIREGLLLGAAVLLLAVRPLAAAGSSGGRADRVRVIWVHPQRISAARRPALARLLAAAVAGELPRGLPVRDSRPQIIEGWRAEIDPGVSPSTAARGTRARNHPPAPAGLVSLPVGETSAGASRLGGRQRRNCCPSSLTSR